MERNSYIDESRGLLGCDIM